MSFIFRHARETDAAVQGDAAPNQSDRTFQQNKELATGATHDLAAVFDKTFGKDLRTLADPKSSALDCAKAFSSLAGNVKDLVSVKGAIDTATDFALKRLERDELPKIAQAVHAGKFGESAHEIGESVEKVREDVKTFEESKGLISHGLAAYHLKRDLGKLETQMTEAAEHLHGARGEHAMAPGGAGTVALVASPLDALEVGQHASISNGQNGPSVQQTPELQHAPEVGRA